MDSPAQIDLISQIKNIEEQIQAYLRDDSSKSIKDLENLSASSLKEWLNIRSTKLQMLIDEGIDQTKNDCSVKP